MCLTGYSVLNFNPMRNPKKEVKSNKCKNNPQPPVSGEWKRPKIGQVISGFSSKKGDKGYTIINNVDLEKHNLKTKREVVEKAIKKIKKLRVLKHTVSFGGRMVDCHKCKKDRFIDEVTDILNREILK